MRCARIEYRCFIVFIFLIFFQNVNARLNLVYVNESIESERRFFGVFRQYFVEKYGTEKYFDAVAKQAFPRVTLIGFAPENVIVIQTLGKRGRQIDYKRYIHEIVGYMDSLSYENDTIYANDIIPESLFFSLCRLPVKDLSESLMDIKFNFLLFSPLYYTAIVTRSGHWITDCHRLLVLQFVWAQFFYTNKFRDLYRDCCKQKGLREINYTNIEDTDFSIEEKGLLIDFIRQENEYLMRIPMPEERTVIPFTYEAKLSDEEYIIYENDSYTTNSQY